MIPGLGIAPGSSGTSNKPSLIDVSQGPITMEVPLELKNLIRMVMKAFYGFELYLCMEMLLYHQCIKEEDLADLLRLDLKVVHQHLVNLKREKFINEYLIMNTSTDGRQSKHSYYYINYKMMVNVIKYKLVKIRMQIETEETQGTSRANYKCTNCQKTYSDLDTKYLFPTMSCLYCGAAVDEDSSCLPSFSSRNLRAKFNTQLDVVYQILKNVENIRLADDILQPKPVDLTLVLEKMNNNSSQSTSQQMQANKTAGFNGGKSAMVKFDPNGKWSGDKTRNTDLMGQTRISINFDSSDGSSSSHPSRPKKDLPAILLSNRTNENDYDTSSSSRDNELLNSLKMAADATLNHHKQDTASSSASLQANPDLAHSNATNLNRQSSTLANISNTNLESIIMQKLLIHEKKNSAPEANALKKRALNDLNKTGTAQLYDEKTASLAKKRKLNNGGLSYKSYSDGSDRELDEQDDESNSYYTDNSNTILNDNDESSSNNNDMDYETYVPLVSVQSKFYRLDKLNTYLINLMNDSEKEHYIDICRQLYTEIYEI